MDTDPAWKSQQRPASNTIIRKNAGSVKTVFGFSVKKSANVNEDLLEELSIHDPSAEVNEDGNDHVYLAFSSNQIKSADPVTYDDNGNVIPLSRRFDPEQMDIRYQQATDDETYSPRTLLSGALLSAAQSEADKEALENYQLSVKTLDAKQAVLADRRAKIRDLSFAKGKRDADQINLLRANAESLSERITKADQRLLQLESTAPLQRVLEVAKRKAAARGPRQPSLSRFAGVGLRRRSRRIS